MSSRRSMRGACHEWKIISLVGRACMWEEHVASTLVLLIHRTVEVLV